MIRIPTLLALAACGFALAAAAQTPESRSKTLRASDWDPRGTTGTCQLRIWVDERARIRMRGDEIWVATEAGERAYDQGSHCSQPLPFRRLDDLRITADRGRGGIENVQRPNRRNNYTASVTVSDPQPGGALYLVDLAWTAGDDGRPGGRPGRDDPLPWFDEVRACQDRVRAEFLRRTRGDAYLEFPGIADRAEGGRERDRITGRAIARNRSISREISWECVVNERAQAIETANFRYQAP